MSSEKHVPFEVVLELISKPDSADRLRAWLKENLPDTRDYEGCLAVQALQDADRANRILVIGQWVSRSHWEKYIEWREARGDLATVGRLAEAPPSFNCFDVLGEWRTAT